MSDFCYLGYSQNLMLTEINIYDIDVSTTGCLLPQNNSRCNIYIQHDMSDRPDFNNISIDNYKPEIFPTFLLAYCVYITRSLNRVFVEVISNIEC